MVEFFLPALRKIFARRRHLGREFRIKARKLILRCPRRLRVLGGPFFGGLVGLLVGNIPGALIGLLLAYLLKELFSKALLNRKIYDYLENPGAQQFYEGEPGLAAWCALAALIASEASVSERSLGGTAPPEISPGSTLFEDRVVKEVILKAAQVFPGPFAEPYLVERFSRAAMSRGKSLNSDLLAESLAARRAPLGDAGDLGRGLSGLAAGEKARNLVREIRFILDPARANEEEPESAPPFSSGTLPADPWKILGLAPGTDPKEIKAHYRRLAKQFHPDELQVLDEKQREAAARAFMAIKEAYKQISGGS